MRAFDLPGWTTTGNSPRLTDRVGCVKLIFAFEV